MDIMKRIKSGANRVTQKAQNMVEINKIKAQITEVEREMDTHYLQMGKVFYVGYQTEDMSVAEIEMVKLSKACDTLWEDVEGLRGRIAELQNERLCDCGHGVELNVNFCPHCGTKMSGSEPKNRQEKVTSTEKQSIRPEELEILNPNYADTNENEDQVVDKQPQSLERERRQVEELERERERQLELDRRIRYWKGQDDGELSVKDEGEAPEETFNCQICAVDLPLGSKWCPRCGAEQI
ncbi:zinc ribbon domain-containing protein [Paenibacillus sp. FA6]|uniref:zinc ribbon domain-containing protein n=1 Tax=Paenibacillus sp. FA6 TaxID=3413029 RepID=UPI003F65D78D